MSSQKNKNNYLDEFIKDLSQWALNIMSGDLSSRIKTSDSKDLKTLSSNINIVSEMLENQLSKTNEQLDQFSKYKEERLKKLDYWEENSWNSSLLELFMDDIYRNNLDPNKDFASFKENFYKVLQAKLEKITDHKFNRLSEEQVMQKLSKIFESKIF